MKELQVSPHNVDIRNANVITTQGYDSPAHVIKTVHPGTIRTIAQGIAKYQPIMIEQTCYNIEHYT
eukprot:729764-Heterocapsa_arctica.AAC.1